MATVKKAAPKKKVAKKAAPKKKAAAKPQRKEIDALYIKTKPGVASFRRAGHKFDEQGHGIALDALNKEQIKQLKDEKNLIVEAVTIPAE
ncbi:hypothetical protein BOW53_03010 [Solemya pervernicosa gill symbiont]|uniref:Mu-like prophage FluMu N-terminal domain-containing protein n=1 Tax=Solemya pervernicosa gill symbiont TaxID=642797 RepID=A0A1T2L988_9GAMM|nr:hypothetical protein [Solemya pervernicosa gill symbiont]OOZ41663.1 hypothetical protein BOW53_03010 [Solemya pervernicosa gill symbiont]